MKSLCQVSSVSANTTETKSTRFFSSALCLTGPASWVEGNKLSVRQELQADCFAGIWAYNADRSRQLLESGDIEEGLNAASAIGDDRLQKQSQGYVSPDSFTHGSSAQRVKWFKIGFQGGDLKQCDTFSAKSL
ncbi:MAG: hypothetical protein DBP01_20055 [gamma proteobacterium symbiont of Ctena orbiculata]|nr:MAG: hypothetical protein DBP01_20055 [gamma proteobacterium symbiont of Ctena orbiculata]